MLIGETFLERRDGMNRQFEKVSSDTLVISRTEEGFRVYSPASPLNSYIVSGSPEEPLCTCLDFQHAGSVNWRCKHIEAVLNQFNGSGRQNGGADAYQKEERLAIQNENNSAKEELPSIPERSSQMLLKRSVSPDGRIDSLSVEFTIPVDQITEGEIKAQAVKTLRMQSEIVGSFLHKKADKPENSVPNGSIPARMLGIAGLNTKWGRRLFISIEANGDTLKLFGGQKQLAEAIAAAGYPQLAKNIDERVELNIPCRITTKQIEDGRYLNVDRVFPSNGHHAEQRERR
jgi:hypothetical protein